MAVITSPIKLKRQRLAAAQATGSRIVMPLTLLGFLGLLCVSWSLMEDNDISNLRKSANLTMTPKEFSNLATTMNSLADTKARPESIRIPAKEEPLPYEPAKSTFSYTSEAEAVALNEATPPPPSQSQEGKRLALVLFSHLKTTDRFNNLIFPALETYWLDQTDPIFVVMTPVWTDAYRDLCLQKDCSLIHPLWVDCPESIFGESPCCKQEKGLLLIPPDYDYAIFADDDMYFKIEPLKQYLAGKLGFNASEEVFIVTAGGVSPKGLGQYGYKGRRSSPYLCSDNVDYRYPWGQPVIYSRAALNLITPGLKAGGLVKQCLEFNLTHDVGNSVFHWMYSIPDYAVKIHMFPNDNFVQLEMMGVHGIHRYIDEINRTVTMQNVYEQPGAQDIKFKKYQKERHFHGGFNRTDTFAQYGPASSWGNVWHTMPVSDCMDPEMKKELLK